MLIRGIQAKLITSLGVLVAGFVLLIVMVLWSTGRTRQFVSRMSIEFLPANISSQQAESAFARAVKLHKEAVLLQDPKDLTAAAKELNDVRESLNNLRNQTFSDRTRLPRIEATSGAVALYQRQAEETYTVLIKDPDHPSSQILASVAMLAAGRRDIAASLATLHADTAAALTNQLSTMNVWSLRERRVSLLALACGLLWVGISLFLVQRQIVQPIRRLSARLRDIAEGEGDLTRRLTVGSADELGELAQSFNVFVDHVQRIMVEVASAAVQLSSATSGISTLSAQAAERASREQVETEQIALSVQEIASSVADVSRRSQTAAESAQHAVAIARQGGSAVQQTVLTMQTVSTAVEAAAAQIVALDVHSTEIGAITGVIQEIAEQTNLLALNAAIEAARAGDHGRGFAVVAREVRVLAERTAKAATRISLAVGAVQSGTQAAVETMRRGTEEVKLGVQSAAVTGDALERIVEANARGESMITGVAAAAAQQATGTSQVTERVGRITNLTRETAGSARRGANASTELSALARHLEKLISRFQLEANTP